MYTGVNRGLALFRPSALTEPLAEAIYARRREAPEALRRPLLEEERLLADWWQVAPEMLAERLLAHGRKAFAPLRELSVDDLLRRRSEEERRSLAQELDIGALPLLRANFDRLGGAVRPSRDAYVLCAQPEASALIPWLDYGSTTWESLPMGDPYIVAFLRVCAPLPLAALQELLAQTGEAYWPLDKEARRELHLVDSWADLPDVGSVAEHRRRT